MISDGALENLVKFAIAGGVDITTATNIGIAGVKAFGMEMTQLVTSLTFSHEHSLVLTWILSHSEKV